MAADRSGASAGACAVRTPRPARRTVRGSSPTPRREAARRVVAPLVWGRLEGTVLTDADRRLLEDGLGGIVLFGSNVADPDAAAHLIAAARAAASGPLRVAVDQEGGHVVRFGEPLTRFPGPMGLAATGDPDLARAVAHASARELAALGVDVVLAPDLDLALAPTNPALGARTFGDDPNLVAAFGRATIDGYLAGGVLPVAKHFPGHGRPDADSHLDDPAVSVDLDTLVATDLVPFRAAVAAGVPALMLGHVRYEALAPGVPASLSHTAVALARGRLGFDGLLVTDALVMDAVARHRPVVDAALAALLAGNDVVMAIEAGWRVVDELAAAFEAGRLPSEVVAAASRRVAAFDRAVSACGTEARGIGTPEDGRRQSRDHSALADLVAARSLTLVGGARDVLPLGTDARVAIVGLSSSRTSPVEDAAGSSDDAAHRLAAALGNAAAVSGPAEEIGDAAAALADESDVTVLLTRDAFLSASARSLIVRLSATSGAIVRIALRSPVDLALPPLADVSIAAYADTPPTIDALARAIRLGRAAFPGRLPIRAVNEVPSAR